MTTGKPRKQFINKRFVYIDSDGEPIDREIIFEGERILVENDQGDYAVYVLQDPYYSYEKPEWVFTLSLFFSMDGLRAMTEEKCTYPPFAWSDMETAIEKIREHKGNKK